MFIGHRWSLHQLARQRVGQQAQQFVRASSSATPPVDRMDPPGKGSSSTEAATTLTPEQQQAVWAAKDTARRHVKALLKLLSEETMNSESQAIAKAVISSAAFSAASKVGMYVHCAKLREVNTALVLQAAMDAGKTSYVPAVNDKESNMTLLHLDDTSALVSVPPFGIMEPSRCYHSDGAWRDDVVKDGIHLDLLLMPGLAFDRTGRRLGRGGGYYDKMVATLQRQASEAGKAPPLLVALAYSAQLLPEVPVDAHDQCVDAVITSTEVITCTERGRQAWG